MLLELVVENYAVVERLRVHFHAGLNLLTGETGSGGNPGTGRCQAVASISLGKRPCGKRPTCFGRVVARSERMDRARKVRLSSITLARSPDHFTPCLRLASERDARC